MTMLKRIRSSTQTTNHNTDGTPWPHCLGGNTSTLQLDTSAAVRFSFLGFSIFPS
eukprot:m.67880 g.67880  ORF g.67880 m.67880 type:complete len:55 (+) comp49989_c0_seq2:885-1049(+)